MSGSTKMYRLRPIIDHDVVVKLPSCMYNLKNIHVSRSEVVEQSTGQGKTSSRNLDISEQNQGNSNEMAELQAKQEQILQQLAQLKKQMDAIKGGLNITTKNQPTPIQCTKPMPPIPDEIVINASPTNPPYSLQFVQKNSVEIVQFVIKTYIHSSVTILGENAKELGEKLENFTFKPAPAKCNVKLIWKEVGSNAELVVGQSRILGEVNILRFLSRHLRNLMYESQQNPEEIDSLLDTVYCISNARSKTERAALFPVLNRALGKENWLCGRQVATIADLAAFSALKQVPSNEINVNLTKWFERCAKV